MIRRLVLRNWQCFRGEHVVELGPHAHAVVCRYESDAGRSNYGGKSALLEAIDFAVTGRTKKDRRFDADGWISRGEKEGAVSLTLEDGATIARERRRGQATQARFTTGDGIASQDEASAAILKHLRFDADDFRNLAYFEQKAMARLVLTEPEKRLDIVRGWLGLERAEAASERASEIAADVVRELEKMRARRDALDAMVPTASLEESAEALAGVVRAAEARVEAARAKRLANEESNRQRRDDVDLAERYERVVADGKALAAEVAKFPHDVDARAAEAERAWAATHAALMSASAEVTRRKRVSLGQFDGRCPVAEIECPAKKQINADRVTSSEAHAAAKLAEDRAANDHLVATGKKNIAARAAAEARDQKERLERLRDLAREQAPDAKSARLRLKSVTVDSDALAVEQEEREALEARDAARERSATAKAAREQRERVVVEVARLQEAIDTSARDVAVALRSRGVLRAAQRRVAERALEAINARAATMLAGADLSVELRWEREGKGPAKQCEECGAAFPASARVKACEACGAARGQLIVQRLEFLPSDRSGAADDIAGVSLQLAAGAWFLTSRASPWATAILDEPMAACDKTNRKSMALQLVRLLGAGAWRQSLVIAHSSEAVEMFPARIEVVVGRDGSRRVVQS